jgi:hypothetical protein
MIDDQAPKIEPDTPTPITNSTPRSTLTRNGQLNRTPEWTPEYHPTGGIPSVFSVTPGIPSELSGVPWGRADSDSEETLGPFG